MSIKCGHCRERHETVAEVRECSQHSATHGMAARYQFFDDDVPEQPAYPGRVSSGYRPKTGSGRVSTRTDAAKVRKPAAEGIYRKAGSIYKVQIAHHGSGKPYAKRLTETATIDPKSGKPKWKWVYAPGFVNELRSEHLLTLEEAKEFGKLYGVCCVCGAILTNEESIENGIGPICAQKF